MTYDSQLDYPNSRHWRYAAGSEDGRAEFDLTILDDPNSCTSGSRLLLPDDQHFYIARDTCNPGATPRQCCVFQWTAPTTSVIRLNAEFAALHSRSPEMVLSIWVNSVRKRIEFSFPEFLQSRGVINLESGDKLVISVSTTMPSVDADVLYYIELFEEDMVFNGDVDIRFEKSVSAAWHQVQSSLTSEEARTHFSRGTANASNPFEMDVLVSDQFIALATEVLKSTNGHESEFGEPGFFSTKKPRERGE